MPLPWAPKSLLSDTDEWSFTNGANRAMTDLATMGERLMQPVGQQVRSVVEQALPEYLPSTASTAPATQPSPAPQPVVPSVPRFSLGKIEDWLTPAGPAQPAPQLEAPATPQMPAPATTAAPAPTGMFSLPSLESFLGRPSSAAAPGPAAAPSPPGPAGPPPAFGPIVGGNKADFLRTAGPIAARVEQETGIPARLSLAISANETGWGNPKHTPGGAYHGIQAQRGEAGTGYTDVTATGQPYQASLRSFASPYEAFRGFADFLRQNPRYAPALATYKQTGDANRLAADIKAAGYAEDPAYTSKIQAIMAGIPDIQGPGPAPSTAAPGTGTLPKPTPGPGWGTYTPETGAPLTVNQFTQGKAEGLSTEEALAVCGPAAAIAFARTAGRNPTLREAKDLASNLGLWDVNVGMHGPASQVQLLEKLGVPSRLTEGADEAAIAREVQAGRPTIVDTSGHYYVATGYDPQTRRFDFGESAKVLKSSGGRSSYRLDELASLGMGAPRASIFMGSR